jgi:NO-binding membrane sensor protein with MHYT domain
MLPVPFFEQRGPWSLREGAGLTGSYDAPLVALSMVVAVMASYVALDLGARVSAASHTRARWCWLLGGAVSMGVGIWSMHFIGMLAFDMGMPASYDASLTLLSLLIGMGSSALALWVISHQRLGRLDLLGGGIVMGAGIAAMHYTGMAAMHVDPPVTYSLPLVALSLLVAVFAATAAIWIAFWLRSDTARWLLARKGGSALLMGLAIYGMHYIGMAAATFAPHSAVSAAGHAHAFDARLMGVAIAVLSLLLLSLTLLVATVDARLAGRAARHAHELAQSNALLRKEVRERLKAEAALEREKAFLLGMLENLHDGIVACDHKGRLTLLKAPTAAPRWRRTRSRSIAP